MQHFQQQYTFTLQNYQCEQLYPFSCKNKRYFRAVKIDPTLENQNQNNQLNQQQQKTGFRVITYPIQMINHQQLVKHLIKIKELDHPHPILGKIIQIKEKTVLVTQSNNTHLTKQDVLAVFIEESYIHHLNNQNQSQKFYHFYENLIEYGPYSQKIVRTYASKLIDLISYLKSKDIQNGFFPEDLFIQKHNYQLRLDNYGDRKFFKTQNFGNSILSDSWQLGNAIFTFFNRYPPYNQTNSNDKFFQLLKNQSYDKFWQKNKRKNITPLKAQSFLNICFNEQTQWKTIILDQNWLKSQKPLSRNQLYDEMQKIYLEQVAQKLKIYERNKISRQTYQSAIRNRNIAKRGTPLDIFIDKYNEQFQLASRKANPFVKSNSKNPNYFLIQTFYDDDTVLYAYLLSLLQQCQNQHSKIPVCQIQDRKTSITFRLDGMVDDGQLQIDMKVILQVVQDINTQQKFIKIQMLDGSIMQRLWAKRSFEMKLCETEIQA